MKLFRDIIVIAATLAIVIDHIKGVTSFEIVMIMLMLVFIYNILLGRG